MSVLDIKAGPCQVRVLPFNEDAHQLRIKMGGQENVALLDRIQRLQLANALTDDAVKELVVAARAMLVPPTAGKDATEEAVHKSKALAAAVGRFR